jgi:hypothetical protein
LVSWCFIARASAICFEVSPSNIIILSDLPCPRLISRDNKAILFGRGLISKVSKAVIGCIYD